MTRYRHIVIVIIVALLIPILPFAIIGEMPGEHWLSAADENALQFGMTGFGILASDVLLPIPSSIIGTLLGARLGFTVGTLWTWAGLMLGNLIGYATGRLLLAGRAQELPQAPTLLVVFASRPVPVQAEAAMFVAGAERMRLAPVIVASTLGNAIYAGALAGNGALLLPDALLGPGLMIPMAVPVLGWLIWRRVARSK
jgi:uncharacterized membrane protein YdjX (TVP38/TMEM64 family)